ncbi:tetratricopeptide repeat protein [Plantactinospora siamensis]|uniref:Tetratricopeptide repeat protein n=1 Tax=Plantactinospora siamensis TaxID=555372 RepID=A0ABV6NXL7_9ACTN
MTARNGFFGRLASALAAHPGTTAASAPLPTRTRLAAALAARPITRAEGSLGHTAPAGPDRSAYRPGDVGVKLAERVKWVVAEILGTTADQLRVDSDGDLAIRAGSAMIFVRAQEDPPLVDVFSPLLSGVQPTETLYRRLADLTSGMMIGRIYCTGDTVWASIPVFGQEFQPTHLLVAIRAMVEIADDLDDQLRHEFGGSRFFGDEAAGISPVPDPTGYLRDLADSGETLAGSVLVDLLADRGRTDELRTRAERGDWHAAARLAALLRDAGRLDEAEQFWRIAADRGEPAARTELATLLANQGRPAEAIDLLRDAAADDWRSVGLLLTLLTEQGRVDEAVELLRRRAGRTPGPAAP